MTAINMSLHLTTKFTHGMAAEGEISYDSCQIILTKTFGMRCVSAT